MTTCPVCDAESDKAWRCTECGKPFDGDQDASGAQELRPDGGVDLDLEPTTHDIVLEAIDDLQEESKHGAPVGEVVQATIAETEVRFEDVFETIDWLHSHGRVYQPARGHLRRTDHVMDLEGGGRDVE